MFKYANDGLSIEMYTNLHAFAEQTAELWINITCKNVADILKVYIKEILEIFLSLQINK